MVASRRTLVKVAVVAAMVLALGAVFGGRTTFHIDSPQHHEPGINRDGIIESAERFVPRRRRASPQPTAPPTEADEHDDSAADGGIVPTSAPVVAGATTRARAKAGAGTEAAQIHFITVQTGATHAWCSMLASAALSGVHVHNLGWKEGYKHIKRPAWIAAWTRAQMDKGVIAPNHLIVFADGGDTMYTGRTPAEVAGRYARLGASAPDLMFNAEANCYLPQTYGGPWGVKKARCIAAYVAAHRRRGLRNVTTTAADGSTRMVPASGALSKFRYLNAGAWIGRAQAVRNYFTHVAAMAAKDKSLWGDRKTLWCDQSLVGRLYLQQQSSGAVASSSDDAVPTVSLDTTNIAFLPTYHLSPPQDLCGKAPLKMCHSGETPALIHFNGKSEKVGGVKDKVMGAFAYDPRLLKSAMKSEAWTVLAGGADAQNVTVASLCGRYG